MADERDASAVKKYEPAVKKYAENLERALREIRQENDPPRDRSSQRGISRCEGLREQEAEAIRDHLAQRERRDMLADLVEVLKAKQGRFLATGRAHHPRMPEVFGGLEQQLAEANELVDAGREMAAPHLQMIEFLDIAQASLEASAEYE